MKQEFREATLSRHLSDPAFIRNATHIFCLFSTSYISIYIYDERVVSL